MSFPLGFIHTVTSLVSHIELHIQGITVGKFWLDLFLLGDHQILFCDWLSLELFKPLHGNSEP